MGTRPHSPNIVGIDSKRTTADQNRIDLRLKAAQIGGIAITQLGYEILTGAARSNSRKSVELYKKGLWTPEMSYEFPDTPGLVFQNHLLKAIHDRSIAELPTLGEDEIADALMHDPMIINVPTRLLTSLSDVAVERNIGPDTLADAVARDAVPDHEAILAGFNIYPEGTLRLVTG